MKKKVFSKLLMVALVATVGVFTSCKDYDDDINDLRSKLDGLNTSLTNTVDSKITAVNTDIKALETQLNQVKEDYAKADANLKTLLDEAAATGKANTTAIESLKQEIVDLKATDANLTAAINELKSGLADANATITSQGKTIAGLLEADKSLQKGIDEAKSQAANALAEAQKAQAAAQTNAETLAGVKADLATAQKQIADNLTSVNKKIDDAVADLSSQINVISGKVNDLSKTVSANTADITTINGKLSELTAKDTEILAALETAKKQLQDADTQAAANLTAAIDRISANETAIKYIQETTIPELIRSLVTHVIPETVTSEVAKQLETALPEALKEYMKSDDIKALVATETGKNLTLIQALQKKVKDDSIAIRKYVDTEFVITVQSMIDKSIDTKAAEIKKEYEAADKLVQDSVDAVAATLKGVQAQIGDANSGMVKQIADLEAWFETNDEGLTKIGENIINSNAFATKVKDFVNKANGEILGMITAIHLFANQHMAQCDEYGKVRKYTEGEGYEKTYGYDNFDHTLTFVYTIEQGLDWDYCAMEAKTPKWNYPEGLINQLKGIKSVKDDKVPADYDFSYNKGGFTGDEEDYDFVDGRFVTYSDSVLVRVSPTNADLRDAEIVLLNSKGENIVEAGLVKIEDVQKYTREDYITREPDTRAVEGNETGLWVIKFNLNGDSVGTLYPKYASYKGGDIVYAVAVKNAGVVVDEETAEVVSDAERYVVSEYDLTLGLKKAYNAWNFTVNGVSINDIHNRYIMPEQSQNGYTSWTDDPVSFTNTFRYELTWNGMSPCCQDAPEPTPGDDDDDDAEEIRNSWYEFCHDCYFDGQGQLIPFECENEDLMDSRIYEGWNTILFKEDYDNTNAEQGTEECHGVNTVDRLNHLRDAAQTRYNTGVDNRHLKEPLGIEFSADQAPAGETGEWAKIDIKFPVSICGKQTRIRGFFVTLDNHFGIESDNSEINAWATYEFKNVAKYNYDHGKKETDEKYKIDEQIVLQEGNSGTIWIKDAHNLRNGDVLGFRVHAINLDGTFTDPDGRAFYVRIGKLEKNRKMSFHVTTTKNDEAAWALQDAEAADNNQIIVDFNKEQYDNKSDDRFFNRDPYNTDQYDAQSYSVVYYWRGENPAIRAIGNTATNAMFPVANTGRYYYNEKYGYGARYTQNGGDYVYPDGVSPEDVFTFMYSQDANATIDAADIEKNPNDADNTDALRWGIFGSNAKPNKLTQSVKASINSRYANRLVDGATYHLTMEIRRNDDMADGYRVINTYDIDITKVMPTKMPENFGVKSNQLTDGVLKLYLRPLYQDRTTTIQNIAAKPWQNKWSGRAASEKWFKDAKDDAAKAAAFATGFNHLDKDGKVIGSDANDDHMYRWGIDVRPYNLEGIFEGVYTDTDNDGTPEVSQDYFFVFTGAGNYAISSTDKKDYENKDADAIVTYRSSFDQDDINPDEPLLSIGAYTAPAIHWSHIGQKKEIKGGYIYREISAKFDAKTNKFLNPSAKQEGYESLNTSVLNYDWIIDPVSIPAKDGKLEAQYLCAFDEAVMMTNTRGVTGDKVNAKTFEYFDPIIIGADSTQFNIKSKLWYTSDEPAKQAYFDAQLPTALKLGKDKDNKDLNPFDGTKLNVEKNAAVAQTLAQMRKAGYLWVDTTSLKVAAAEPTGYVREHYYFDPFWCDANGKQVGFNNLTNGLYIGMTPKARTEGLPAFQSAVKFNFSFDVYNIWFHKRTVTLTVNVNKPENTTGARAAK